jgi:two-component system sensor histidine kinase/response regulator
MSNPLPDQVVVVIDDDEVMRLSCQQILQKSGYRVETFGNGHAGIRRIKEVKPPLLIVDIKMPELDGFEVIEIVRKVDPDLVIVVITGYATIETAVDAMKAGAYDFLPKPFTPNELRMIIDRGFERWRLTKEAQRLRREKEEVERKFLTLVSHQLKSPLVAVKQYLDVLQLTSREQLSEKGQEWVRRSQVRLGEMLAIIQDWLAVSRIDSGSLCEPGAATDFGKVVAEVIAECRPVPGSPEVHVSASIPKDLPQICGDPMSVTMLMENLISNGIKYNRDGGSVTVTAFREGAFARVEVSDTGIGIPEAALSHLFEEFYRVRSDATAKIPGTGLGLVICRKIVLELGGKIDVKSRQGEGTTFILHLPMDLKESGTEPDETDDRA